MITFSQYQKRYNDELIIKADLDLSHDIYWLKGENGSGKTTLIKSVAGLIPFSGSITVNGVAIHKDRIKYRQLVNYAEAEPLYPAFLTGSDLLRFYTTTKGKTGLQADALIKALGVNTFIHNKVGTYSSGMAKKLSLVLAFTGAPSLILLDEPLITLDQQAVSVLPHTIEEAYKSGISFLITSHQQFAFKSTPGIALGIKDRALFVA